jgi:hypothetical protein
MAPRDQRGSKSAAPLEQRPARTGGLKKALLLLAGVGLMAAALAIVWALESGREQADIQRVLGRWQRDDGDNYILELRQAPGGALEASYFNPAPKHVAKTELERQGESARIIVEIQDVGYPGSTYMLTYDAMHDQLSGTYFQAADRETFQVSFSREVRPDDPGATARPESGK